MWFKNLRIYRFRDSTVINPQTLEAQLQTMQFKPCHRTQASSIGWEPPVRGSEQLAHQTASCIMLCAHKEDKLLPAAVINQHLQLRISEIESGEARKVRAKEKASLKEEIVIDLLPRAFSRHRQLHAYIDLDQQLLIVNSASSSQAEVLINLLRESIGSLGLRPLSCNKAPSLVMTQWLQTHQAEAGFALADECELINPQEEQNRVRCRGQDLTAEEIAMHLQTGKQVSKLALCWQQQLRCILNDDLSISRLRFDELVTDQATATETESAAEQFDQDFAVMSLTLAPFFVALIEAFGGLSDQD